MICIHHSKDLDGWASGAIVKRKYPDARLISYDYGEPFPLTDEELTEQEVIMVDVSIPMPQMFILALKCKHLTYIDHHRSAISDYEDLKSRVGATNITAILQDGIAACEGAWKYLFPDEPMPIAIQLLGEYDTWRNQDKERWDNIILPFQFGMRAICNSPETFQMDLLYPHGAGWGEATDDIIRDGKTILKYQAGVNEFSCRRASFECEFEGLRAICLNGGGFSSGAFESVYDESKHDIMMPFQFNGKYWIISMYTTKDIDCSVIAKKYGGGGHARACGFQTENIKTIFKNIK